MSYHRLLAVVRKETHHILRDRMTFFLVLLTPVALLFIFAYALTTEIKHVPVAVLDYDRTATSRAFVHQVTEGADLYLFTQVESLEEVDALLTRGAIKAALVIGPGFERDLLLLRGMPLQVVIDGTEPESGSFAVEHIGGRAEAFVTRLLSERMAAQGGVVSLQPIDLRVRALYNPGLKPRVDLIPGLISMMLGFPALSVALSLAREREHGTLEQIIATPIGKGEFLVGKMIPYALVGLANVVLMPTIARATFHIPFNGSFLLFFLLSAVFLFAILGMGMVIGVFIRTQPAALALSFLVIFYPGFFMTGIFFPISSMPEMVRVEAMSLPGTHYAVITRGIFLPGVGLDVLWPYGVMLAVLGVAFTVVAAFFFRKRMG